MKQRFNTALSQTLTVLLIVGSAKLPHSFSG